ncbi:MAG: DEAD/DEAH box helicase family protein [Candidatus Nomurabacteria bacterium]|jgi:superfamily II DNA or RNA helicase|nr:DEAD/DEAH box helicase family protein [Candidatus Nomurabacteria bacterium]
MPLNIFKGHQETSDAPKLLDNIQSRAIDDLSQTLRHNSRVCIAAASFSIYAYEALKKELKNIDELRFLFTHEAFTAEKTKKEAREFYIPRLDSERSLYGTDFEIKLRNELNQQAIAKECAAWIKKKARFRANVSQDFISPLMVVENGDEKIAYNPFNNFTTAELGLDRGHNAYSTTTKLFAPQSKQLLDNFNSVWSDEDKLTEVTDQVLDSITAAYKENSPELIYYLALYNIFSEFLEDLNADFLPNEATGFKNSKIWGMLYNFQKDAVLGCISKLEKHGGCILADSVGLGKTFSALGVIKYYESRNKTVLVLCPKRLEQNWRTYKHNYKNNQLADDRLRYDVLFHTDLDRDRGMSGDIDLSMINWGNYDLVVIDESHNFRNGEHSTHKKDEDYENRYQKLLHKIIQKGVKTKVLMLSATPVNIGFDDLKNQLKIAAEGDLATLGDTLKTDNPIDIIFKNANAAFNAWSELLPAERTTEKLLASLSFDFFELLDSVTIARSRKHIETYYKDPNLGNFPTRLKPKNPRPELTDIDGIDYNTLFKYIDALNLDIYTPLKYVYPSKLEKYINMENNSAAKTYLNREQGRNALMTTNLLKRAESSIYAFRLTSQKIYDLINNTLDSIEKFEQGRGGNETFDDETTFAEGDEEDFAVGKKFKIALEDIDYVAWREKLESDKKVLDEMLETTKKITPDHDSKLKDLKRTIKNKIENPINGNNKKILIFTAFADTADYLYENLKDPLFDNFNLNSAKVTGTKTPETTINLRSRDFNEILTNFSPKSKDKSALYADRKEVPEDIDILVATDCISEGQNLQDCDYLINYDIHWNPVRIIQRFGRIDRIGSKNKEIQLVNFWPNITLDDYINLKARVENRMKLVSITATGENTLENSDPDLEYRKSQLKKLQDEVVDIEEMSGGVNIMDLGLNEFHLDLQSLLKKYGEADNMPHGIHAVAANGKDEPSGVIFVLKNLNQGVNIDHQNRLHPFYLVYLKNNGEVITNHLNPKDLLDKFKHLCMNTDTPIKPLLAEFNEETEDGKNMKKYSDLLARAIESIITVKSETDIDSLFSAGETSALENPIKGLGDFELINFLVVK